MKHPIAKIITEQGTITLELFPEHAPNAVSGFLWAIEKGVFRGRDIKRIVPGFVLQPSYDLTQEPEFYHDVVTEVWDCTKWTTKVI